LNFGLRYEPVTRPVEVNNLDQLPFGCDCNNLAPALDLPIDWAGTWGSCVALTLFNTGRIFPATYGQQRFNPPANIGIYLNTPTLQIRLQASTLRTWIPIQEAVLTVISPDLVLPYSHQYNLSWEAGSWAACKAAAWVCRQPDTQAVQFTFSTNRAQRVEGIPTTLQTVDQRRPDQDHYMIYKVANASEPNYDAGRVSVIFPLQRKLELRCFYWFSKSIDVQHN